MKYLLITILTALLTFGTAQAADTGVWYSPETNGEGINLYTRDETLVLYYFTYRDEVHAIPPIVSPVPPQLEQVGENLPAWYLGIAHNFDGESATGELYAAEAFDFPIAFNGSVAAAEQVGTFELVRDNDGWLLDVSYSLNYLIPWYVSLYGLHEFSTPLFIPK